VKRSVARRAASVLTQWAFSAAVVYAVWEWLLAPHLSRVFLAPPSAVWDQLTSWAANGTMWSLSYTTFSEAFTGFVIGSAAGVLFALCIGLSSYVTGKVLEPLVVATYAMPKFVLVPIVYVWLGSNFLPRALLVTVAVFPLVAIYTLTGIRTVDPDQVTMMRLLGAGRVEIATKLLVPHTMRYLVSGLTFSFPHAVTMAIGAEILFGTTSGLGGTLYTEAQQFNAAAVLSALIIATILAALLTGICRLLGNAVLASFGAPNNTIPTRRSVSRVATAAPGTATT
jgi:NitT/TauT family transport system permease protein